MGHKLKLWLFVIGIMLSGVGGAVLWGINQLNHVYQKPETSFDIIEGDTTSNIIDTLVKHHFIQHPNIAISYIYFHHLTFMPGSFTIPDQYTMPELLTLFNSSPKKENRLTIPEGWNREQIADALAAHNLSGAIFLSLTKDYEGQLFPDTYNLDSKTTEKDLVDRMTGQYAKKTAGLGIGKNELILASIVEREAKNDSDRAIIAGIYKHRLSLGMALEADPTVQYAKYVDLDLAPIKNGKKDYWAPITAADYKGVNSPYNTYLNAGLPPTPICNPGLKSITAAASPANTDAVYFLHTKDGRIVTARTLEEHNANKARYLR